MKPALTKVTHTLKQLHPMRISAQLHTFLRDESIGGKLILAAALLSIICVNSPLMATYEQFWHLPLSVGLGNWDLSMDLRHWVNEGLMTFFFLVAGLEIKRELVKGELRDLKSVALPVGAAVGGMVLPAIFYLAFNAGGDSANGWGIPIATDIAFAVAVIGLLGKRVPSSLKIFLLTLAIADDIGAIFVIALFYANIIHTGFLIVSIAVVLGIFVFHRFLKEHLPLVILLGICLWATTHLSGIHASIVGAIMGLLAPIATSRRDKPVAERLEYFFLPVSTFFVLPVFAFANAGFLADARAFTANRPVMLGVLCGLIFGKAFGITLASWLLVKLRFAKLPDGISWHQILGVGFIAGIGFTMSIFITELAFADQSLVVTTAKAAIFIASIISAMVGYTLLRTKAHPV